MLRPGTMRYHLGSASAWGVSPHQSHLTYCVPRTIRAVHAYLLLSPRCTVPRPGTPRTASPSRVPPCYRRAAVGGRQLAEACPVCGTRRDDSHTYDLPQHTSFLRHTFRTTSTTLRVERTKINRSQQHSCPDPHSTMHLRTILRLPPAAFLNHRHRTEGGVDHGAHKHHLRRFRRLENQCGLSGIAALGFHTL